MKIFKKVHCKAYLKKASDGVHIQMYQPSGEPIYGDSYVPYDVFVLGVKAIAYKWDAAGNSVELADLSNFEGDTVEKVYRTRVEKEFDGFVVGFTTVDVKGCIGTDWIEDEHRSFGYCFKTITSCPHVAVVYFKNNMKRYVLLEDMEYLEEN